MKPYELPRRGDRFGKNRIIDFSLAQCTVPEPYTGLPEGEFHRSGGTGQGPAALTGLAGGSTREGHAAYFGSHHVEVYIVKGRCASRATDSR